VASVTQTVFLGGALIAGALCAVEWGVRSRRLNPFSALARTTRKLTAPVIGRVERRVVRAGGNPVNAPWWALGAIVVTGIIALSLLDIIRGQVAGAYAAVNAGPRGVIRLVVRWGFFVLYIGILVRVVSSWFRLNPFGPFVRWSYTITEPLLRPIRSILPAFGMIDLSPLVLYLALRLLEVMLLRLI